MIGIGTLINTGAIIGGSALGLLLGRAIPKQMTDSLIRAAGVSTMVLGILTVAQNALEITDGTLTNGSSMMIAVSLCLGTALGELLHIEQLLERFAAWLKVKTKSQGDDSFINAFLTATFTVCIGAMAIVGSIEDGLSGDCTTLVLKSVLDMVIIMVMSANLGKGCLFSFIPVLVLQGTVTVFAHYIKNLITEQSVAALSCVGAVLIFCVGVNLVWDKRFRVANMLPSVVIAAAWGLASQLLG